MAVYTGAASAFDERTSGRDSAFPSDRFRLEPGVLAWGGVSSSDPSDYYALPLQAGYAYRVIVSLDPANAPVGDPAWNNEGAGLFAWLVGPTGAPQDAYGATFLFDAADGALVFTVPAGPAPSPAYLELFSLGLGPARYVATLEQTPLTPAGQRLSGTDGTDSLVGGDGDDVLDGGAGDDFLAISAGQDLLDGGPGHDRVFFDTADSVVEVDLDKGQAYWGTNGASLLNVEGVTGSLQADRLLGSAAGDEIDANDGDDHVEGRGGDDDLTGGPGDDSIDGGEGVDWAYFEATRAQSTVTFDEELGVLRVTTPLDGSDQLIGVEYLSFVDEVVDTAPLIDRQPPTLLSGVPAEGSTDAPVDADIVLTFSESISPGSGSITLRRADGEVVARYPVATSGNLSFDGGTLTIDPSVNLDGQTSYVLELPASAVVDQADNPLSGELVLRFGTARAPLQASVADVSTSEAADTLRFTVRLSEAAPETYTVRATVSGATASPDVDFVPASELLTIAAGQSEAELIVTLLPDDVFESSEVFLVTLSEPSHGIVADGEAQGRIDDDDGSGLDLPDDPLLGLQWYLYPGIGANVLPVWADYTGAGVRVGVFDQGIDPSHPDLAAQLDPARGRDVDAPDQPGGNPERDTDNHGTAVAGVAAAARNGMGIVGVAYGATLVSLYSPLDATFTADTVVSAYTLAHDVDVLNDSWGYAPQYYSLEPWAFYDNFRDDTFRPAGDALARLAADGRGGLGTVVVQSAGNSYDFGDDVNLHSFQNSRYVITVAATDFVGQRTGYSSPGASVLVAAPGGGGSDPLSDIFTTDRVGEFGFDEGDHVTLRGTSFASPVVSGVVALMLEANPMLGWRDVQTILAYSARRTAGDAQNWTDNGSRLWNGGGLHFDGDTHDLGFGLVDAHAAVRLAETWGSAALTSANLEEARATRRGSATIPDGEGAVTQTVNIVRDLVIERVEVTVDIDHTYIGDLSLRLVSPAGTEAWLLRHPGRTELSPYGLDQNNIDFTFTSVLSMGEHAVGTWTLSVQDDEASDIGTLKSWSLNVIGRPATVDDRYVYTDEYAESVALDASRATLQDGGGVDTIHAAAVTSDSLLDLRPGSASRVDGTALNLPVGTQIEHAIGGDGADTLIGNAAANQLRGMRGDDVLRGEGGNDRLDGGAGHDVARYAGRLSDYQVTRGAGDWTVENTAGRDGRDTLIDIERVQFSDFWLALDTTGDGHALQVGQIGRALFGASVLAQPALLGIGLALLDGGTDYAALVSLALDTDLFAALAGSRSNDDFVALVYRNVVGSTASAAVVAAYAGMLDSGQQSQQSLALLACQIDINTASVDLLGLAEHGVVYLPAPA